MNYLYLTFLILVLVQSVSAQYPAINDFVTDNANIIDAKSEQEILALAKFIEQNSTVEIAVVTVNSLDGLDIESYAVELFEQARIGKKDLDNGILILIAPNERRFRIEVGYGLEGTIPDAKAMEIGNNILVPAFRNNDFGSGIYNAVLIIGGHLQNNEEVISEYNSVYANRSSGNSSYFGLFWLILLLISFGAGGFGYRRNRTGFMPIFIGGFGGGMSGGRGGFGGFGGGLSGGGGFSGGW